MWIREFVVAVIWLYGISLIWYRFRTVETHKISKNYWNGQHTYTRLLFQLRSGLTTFAQIFCMSVSEKRANWPSERETLFAEGTIPRMSRMYLSTVCIWSCHEKLDFSFENVAPRSNISFHFIHFQLGIPFKMTETLWAGSQRRTTCRKWSSNVDEWC